MSPKLAYRADLMVVKERSTLTHASFNLRGLLPAQIIFSPVQQNVFTFSEMRFFALIAGSTSSVGSLDISDISAEGITASFVADLVYYIFLGSAVKS